MPLVQDGYIILSSSNVNELKDLTAKDCLGLCFECKKTMKKPEEGAAAPDGASVLVSIGGPDCRVKLALHPFFRLLPNTDAAIPENWKVVGWEVLARSDDGSDNFPFLIYSRFNKKQRMRWTLLNACLSAELQRQGITAKFNVQPCDFAELCMRLQRIGISIENTNYEVAEYDEVQGGTQIMGTTGPPARAPPLGEWLLSGEYINASLDDCMVCEEGDPRSVNRTVDIVKQQAALRAQGLFKTRAFHTVKVDCSSAFVALTGFSPKNNKDAVSEEQRDRVCDELDKAVRAIWDADPEMCFVVEGSGWEKAGRLPILDASNDLVCYQGGPCHGQAISVILETNFFKHVNALLTAEEKFDASSTSAAAPEHIQLKVLTAEKKFDASSTSAAAPEHIQLKVLTAEEKFDASSASAAAPEHIQLKERPAAPQHIQLKVRDTSEEEPAKKKQRKAVPET